jgi:hypothetical protein
MRMEIALVSFLLAHKDPRLNRFDTGFFLKNLFPVFTFLKNLSFSATC